jgi:hypothetical protein
MKGRYVEDWLPAQLSEVGNDAVLARGVRTATVVLSQGAEKLPARTIRTAISR